MSKLKLQSLLHSEMIHFADRIENIFDHHNIEFDDIILIQVWLKGVSSADLMTHVIENILPWKDKIENREDNFFYKNEKIFGQLPKDKVNYFSDVWMSDKLLEEDKDEIWEFFDTFCTCAEEFQKL